MNKLDENKLRRVIKESVKKVISELDWKTYANAANKSLERGNTSYWKDKGENPNSAIGKAVDARGRAQRFGNAAKNAFNRDYGYQNGEIWDDDFSDVRLGGDFDASEEFGPHVVGRKDKGYGNPAKFERGWDDNKMRHSTPEDFFGDNVDAAQSYRNADAELRNYYKGNYRYSKGDGWKLK